MQLPVDHLVYATRDLDRGMEEIERLTGIAPTLGGRHPGRGTRNALVSLGADVYLEIVAPDPEAGSVVPHLVGLRADGTVNGCRR